MKINLPNEREKVVQIKVKVKRQDQKVHTRFNLTQHQNFSLVVKLEVNDLRFELSEAVSNYIICPKIELIEDDKEILTLMQYKFL